MMKRIADFLFETNMLKELKRSGYSFLGSGEESVAEHSFMTAMICFAMSRMVPDVDSSKIIRMALFHDLPEARTGDLNYVQKRYADIHESEAIEDLSSDLQFGDEIRSILREFNESATMEAMLARDADQISFIIELKKLSDKGSEAPDKWIPHVIQRLKTEAGKQIAGSILESRWDDWWFSNYSE